jgi:uracil-DNA glycosylase
MSTRPPYPTAAAFVPDTRSIRAIERAAAGCEGCDLFANATRTVFGEGRLQSDLMLIGEQPGDREDREGRPFVGPAGALLDHALERAGIDRAAVYVTNAVKHFKWTPRGKKRIHRKPDLAEVAACRPWLDAEIRLVRPEVVVCLGATAAQSLLGKDFRVTRDRGTWVESPLEASVTATVHPSSILRADEERREAEMDAFVSDLRFAAAGLRR